MSPRATLVELFRAGLRAVHGTRVVERSLREADPGGECWTLLACGKAAVAMAQGAGAALGGRIARGHVVTKDEPRTAVPELELAHAAHPVPDERGVAAASEALRLAGALGADDRLLVLLSGGASALWSAPVPGVTLAEKRALTELLLRGGVEIGALNAVRKHISRIKGGRLAQAAAPAQVLTLAISDVAGDAPEVIGSGPTSPDPTRFATALEVLDAAGLRERTPASVLAHLHSGAAGRESETPKPDAPCFGRCSYRVVATLEHALLAVEVAARDRQLRVRALGRSLYGEARDCARRLRDELARARAEGADLLVVGGEPTVTVRGAGLGGRAQELALACALEWEGDPGFTALFAGTDGSDGPTEAAGALVDGRTPDRARSRGLDPVDSLARNDSHPLLRATGDLLVTGATHTNVTDLGLILVHGPIG